LDTFLDRTGIYRRRKTQKKQDQPNECTALHHRCFFAVLHEKVSLRPHMTHEYGRSLNNSASVPASERSTTKGTMNTKGILRVLFSLIGMRRSYLERNFEEFQADSPNSPEITW